LSKDSKDQTLSVTLLRSRLCRSQWTESGLRSLACTWQRFLAAGTANGPTPANTSYSTSPQASKLVTRRCSVAARHSHTQLINELVSYLVGV